MSNKEKRVIIELENQVIEPSWNIQLYWKDYTYQAYLWRATQYPNKKLKPNLQHVKPNVLEA